MKDTDEFINEDAEVQYQAKLIVARKKFWTKDTEKLLRKWKTQIRQRYMGHKLSEKKYGNIFYGIGLPMTVMAAISGSGVLATFQNCNSVLNACSEVNSTFITGDCSKDEYIRLVMGLVGIISGALAALFLFIDAGGARKDHKDSASDCDALSRDIEEILIQPIVQRGDPIAQLQRIRNKFDIIVQNSPSIPQEYQKNLEYTSIEKQGHFEPPKSDIDLGSIKRYRGKIPDASVLAEILARQVYKTKQNVATTTDEIERYNDHDTDDEKDVAIPFDPESFRPEDVPVDPIKESLQKALQFELARLWEDNRNGEDAVIEIEDL